MTELELAARYQNQPWYVRLWRRRHLLPVPWRVLRDFLRSPGGEGRETLQTIWRVHIGLAHYTMKWYFTVDEVLETLGRPAMKEKFIRVCYETVTPESAAEGDFEDCGVDDEIALEEEDTVAEVVDYLQGRGLEPSSSHFHCGVWYTEADPAHDRAYFERGEETRHSYHLHGLTEEEELAVYEAVVGAAK